MRLWTDPAVLTALKPMVVGLVIASLVAMQLPQLGYGVGASAFANQVPAGQFERRTISGTVEKIDLDVDPAVITIRARHGTVEVGINELTVVNRPPQFNVGVEAINLGDRVVAFTKRPAKIKPPPDRGGPEDGDTATSTPTATPTATTTATSTDPTATPTATSTDPTATPTATSTPTATPTPTSTPTATPTATSTPTATPTVEAPFRTLVATVVLVFSSKGPTASVKHNRGVKCEVGDEPDTDTDIVTTTPTVTPTPTTTAAFVSFFERSMLAARSVAAGPVGYGGALFRGPSFLQAVTSTPTPTSTSPTNGGGDGECVQLVRGGKVIKSLSSEKLQERFDRLRDKFADDPERLAKLDERQQKSEDRAAEREAKRLDRELQKADRGKTDDKGKPDDKGGGGKGGGGKKD